jgi:glucan phosphoethanolaminetransferase (alkaline phosphatase superfamily)
MSVSDQLFMAFLTLVGVYLAYVSNVIDENSTKCDNKSFKRAVKGIFAVSIILICISIGYMMCTFRCRCDPSNRQAKLYFGFLLAIALTILGLVSTIKTTDTEKGCDKNNTNINRLLVTSSILSGVILMYFVFIFYAARKGKMLGGGKKLGGGLKPIKVPFKKSKVANPFD